jgi:predicted Zn-dependent peptidase
VFDNIQLPAVLQAFNIPAGGTPDAYALEMLSTLLSSGQSSRLYKSLIDNKKIAVQTRAMPMTLEDPGLLILYSIAARGKTATEVETAVNEEIDNVQSELISEEEFVKLRNQTENQFVREKSRALGIASALAEYHLIYGDAGLINKEIERYLQVTREDIQRVAQAYLTPANRTVLYYLPKPKSTSK